MADPTHHNGYEIQKVGKFDLTKCTFIIPLRIDTDDRMRNIITVLFRTTIATGERISILRGKSRVPGAVARRIASISGL